MTRFDDRHGMSHMKVGNDLTLDRLAGETTKTMLGLVPSSPDEPKNDARKELTNVSLRGPSRPTLPSTEEQVKVGGDRDLYPKDSTKEMPDRASHRSGQEEMN
ncbi:hypothetical protein F511_06442 [Dorcoceras hygrometricum]|uniref:Uncharacterized protein n=1 Tax=Dorcoceras hygrometricum TaxID=472368 RepID=A0A2Z7AT99_9LAMI|nr:hypothetical protein F511_06442 [Dorcoceras hygrometricum]